MAATSPNVVEIDFACSASMPDARTAAEVENDANVVFVGDDAFWRMEIRSIPWSYFDFNAEAVADFWVQEAARLYGKRLAPDVAKGIVKATVRRVAAEYATDRRSVSRTLRALCQSDPDEVAQSAAEVINLAARKRA